MTKIQGAVIKEQGVTSAITVVKRHILNSQMQCQQAAQSFQSLFPGMPVVLMGQDTHGTPTYCGRKDIVNVTTHTPQQKTLDRIFADKK